VNWLPTSPKKPTTQPLSSAASDFHPSRSIQRARSVSFYHSFHYRSLSTYFYNQTLLNPFSSPLLRSLMLLKARPSSLVLAMDSLQHFSSSLSIPCGRYWTPTRFSGSLHRAFISDSSPTDRSMYQLPTLPFVLPIVNLKMEAYMCRKVKLFP
jgi:hypothetical protein